MAEDLNRNEDLLAAGAHVPSRRALFQALMGPALVEAAQHIHQEVLAAPDVSEEELVKLVWHDADVASEPARETPAEPALEEKASEELEGHARDAMVAAIASTLEHEVSQWTAEEPKKATQKTDVQRVFPFQRWPTKRLPRRCLADGCSSERGRRDLAKTSSRSGAPPP